MNKPTQIYEIPSSSDSDVVILDRKETARTVRFSTGTPGVMPSIGEIEDEDMESVGGLEPYPEDEDMGSVEGLNPNYSGALRRDGGVSSSSAVQLKICLLMPTLMPMPTFFWNILFVIFQPNKAVQKFSTPMSEGCVEGRADPVST